MNNMIFKTNEQQQKLQSFFYLIKCYAFEMTHFKMLEMHLQSSLIFPWGKAFLGTKPP